MFEKLKGKLSDNDLNSLRNLLVVELKTLADAEKQILNAFPEMIDEANYSDLKEVFEEHREETQEHLERLKEILKSLDEDEEGEKCDAVEGIIKEAKRRMGMEGVLLIKDAALIASAQKIEHYEIAAYTNVLEYAELLGDLEIYNKLSKTLAEEKEESEALTSLAIEEIGISI